MPAMPANTHKIRKISLIKANVTDASQSQERLEKVPVKIKVNVKHFKKFLK